MSLTEKILQDFIDATFYLYGTFSQPTDESVKATAMDRYWKAYNAYMELKNIIEQKPSDMSDKDLIKLYLDRRKLNGALLNEIEKRGYYPESMDGLPLRITPNMRFYRYEEVPVEKRKVYYPCGTSA
jgi:hypothetical protein